MRRRSDPGVSLPAAARRFVFLLSAALIGVGSFCVRFFCVGLFCVGFFCVVFFTRATLVFVGKGAMEAGLRRKVDRLGLNRRVKFRGWRNDLHKIMPLFDVFVLPSLNEGMGRVLVEAMAAGRPIVASRVGSIPDLVHQGVNGLLAPPRDEIQLADSISWLLSKPEEAARMGAAGRLKCREFGLCEMVSKLDGLYRSLLIDSVPPLAAAPSAIPARPQVLRSSVGFEDSCWPPG